jgi:hypothetical protein
MKGKNGVCWGSWLMICMVLARTPPRALRAEDHSPRWNEHQPCFYDGPGLLAAIHATAALGTADSMIEWRRFDLEAQIYDGALTPKGGQISVPQRPGLGLEPEPNVIPGIFESLAKWICV